MFTVLLYVQKYCPIEACAAGTAKAMKTEALTAVGHYSAKRYSRNIKKGVHNIPT
jgi:hypothetical protein